jgi:hypothetical protein
VFVHLPYIADLAPSECNLLDLARDAARGHQFAGVQEVKELLHAWLVSRPKTVCFLRAYRSFFTLGVKSSGKRWDCVEV